MTTNEPCGTMTLKQIKDVLQAEILSGDEYLGLEICIVYAADLMSNVLAFVNSGSLLLTGLTNSQVVRTAEMAEISAVCFVNGKKPEEETIRMAADKHICLMATELFMYECCGRLHEKGLPGNDPE